MDLSRWISLAVAGVYVVIGALGLLFGHASESMTTENLFEGLFGGGLWLAISLGCIWWGDELGEGLIGAKYGLISSTSPGWAVKLMGWVLLLLPAALLMIQGLTEKTGTSAGGLP